MIEAQTAYEADVARAPCYQDGTPRPLWHDLPDIAVISWERNPTPRGWEFTTETTRRQAREYEQGKSHAKQNRADLLGQSAAYDRGWRYGASLNRP